MSKQKTQELILQLKARFNYLLKMKMYDQAIGLQFAIERLDEIYNNEITEHGKETTIGTND